MPDMQEDVSVRIIYKESRAYSSLNVCVVARLRRKVVGQIVHHLAAGAAVQPAQCNQCCHVHTAKISNRLTHIREKNPTRKMQPRLPSSASSKVAIVTGEGKRSSQECSS